MRDEYFAYLWNWWSYILQMYYEWTLSGRDLAMFHALDKELFWE